LPRPHKSRSARAQDNAVEDDEPFAALAGMTMCKERIYLKYSVLITDVIDTPQMQHR